MDINKLKREHQKHVARIAELEQQVAQHEADKRLAVEEAVRSVKLEVDRVLIGCEQLTHERDAALKVGDDLMVTIRQLQADLARMTLDRDVMDRLNQELQLEVKAAEPELIAERAKVASLTVLLQKVQARMKRKELEEQNAILNRKAIAGPKPREIPVERLFAGRALCGFIGNGQKCMKPNGHSGDHEVWDGNGYEEMLPDNSQAVETHRRRIEAMSDPDRD